MSQATIEDLTRLNEIATTLNRAVDVQSALQTSLEQLLDLLTLETGWVFIKDETDRGAWAGRGYRLAAHCCLPPALAVDNPDAWDKGCDCQGYCNKGKLTEAYNEVRCSRLHAAKGEKEGLVIHASAPLRSGEKTLGILNVAAPDWSSFSARDLALLTNVGRQMGIALERTQLYDERELQRRLLARELSIGREIQLGFLPKTVPQIDGWEFAAYYEPAGQVGGDFYDIFPLPHAPHQLGLVVADVAGKGVPAALYMALSRTVIRAMARRDCPPDQMLVEANRLLIEEARNDLFLTAFYGRLDTHTGRFSYVNAGHNRPLHRVQASQTQVELATRGIILGVFAEIELKAKTTAVAPGDALVLYTDGVTEALRADQAEFGLARLRAVVEAHGAAPAQTLCQAIVAAVHAFTAGMPPADDLTLLVVRRKQNA